MKRWLVLLMFVALLAVAAGVGLLTRTGLNWVAGIAVPAGVEYESLEGRLIGPFSVNGLRWQQDNRRLTIGSLVLDWKPASLLARHLNILSIDAEGARWHATSESPASSAPGEPRLPRLPVRITIDRLLVADLRVEQDDGAFAIDLLQLSARFDNDAYRVERLDLQSPALDLSGHAAVGVAAPHSVNAGLSWATRIGKAPVRVNGTLAAQGDAGRLQMKVLSEGGLQSELSGTALRLLTAPAFEGGLEVTRIDPRLTGLEDERLTLSLDVSASPDRLQLEVLADVPSLSPRPLSITSAIGLDSTAITIEDLRASIVDTPAELTVAGTLERNLSALDLRLNWQQLGWPLTGTPTVVSPVGRARLSGALDGYALDLRATAATDGWPETQIAAKGTGNGKRFEIADATLRPLRQRDSDEQDDERLLVHGVIEWQPAPAADLDFTADNLRLERLHPELAGRLSTNGQARVRIPATGAEIAIDIRNIDGLLRGQQLGGSGAVNIRPDNIAVPNVDFVVGDARFEASGTLGGELDLQWDVEIPDLGRLWPPYRGAISTAGRATGPRDRPAVLGSVDVRGLDLAAAAIERLTGRFDVGLDPLSRAEISIDGEGLRVRDLDAGKLELTSQGTVGAQTINVDLDGPAGTLNARLAGGLRESAWRGQITTMRFGRADVGEWALSKAAGVQIETQRLSIDNACFAQQNSSVCIDGALARTLPARADFVLNALPVAAIARLLPPGLEYEGQIDGGGFISLDGALLNGAAGLTLDTGRVTTREGGAEKILLAYEDGRLQARIDDNLLQAELRLDLHHDGIVYADVRAPVQGEGALDGKVRVRLENLDLVPSLIPQIGRVDGRLHAELDLAGTRNAPEASGEIRLDARELVLPDLGITLRQSELGIMTAGDQVTFTGRASSGEGKLDLDGTLRWYEGTPVGRLRLNGTAFRAVDLPELRIDASPQVTISIAEREIAVAGEVGVPAANITPLNIATGVGVSEDQIIVDQAVTTAPDERWQVDATLLVTAGDDVQISGFGLKGGLGGSVLIVQPPGQPATGRGALEVVDGRYRAYGQELTIGTGRLEFTGGPIDDPGLDLRASRQAGEVEAGVQVRGALREPVLTLFSSPPLSDTQTLSYLVTGRGVEELDEDGQTAVSDAATRLALQGGGSLLASSVGRELGLDSVVFEDEGTTASTALVVGKQLSPRLFVSYGIGLFESINTLRLRYRINPRLTLETESEVKSSADLVYSFDR